MKLSHIAFAAIAAGTLQLQAAATPDTDTNTQDVSQPSEAVSWTVSAKGEVRPAALQSVSYPVGALQRAQEGSCTLEIATAPDGRVAGARVGDCTHPRFEREAAALADAVNRESGAAAAAGNVIVAASVSPLTLRWQIED